MKLRGPSNKKKNSFTFNGFIMRSVDNSRIMNIFTCGSIKCNEKVFEDLKNKEYKCYFCKAHPNNDFKDTNTWAIGELEKTNCTTYFPYCSMMCRKSHYKWFKSIGARKRCFKCGNGDKSMLLCAECKFAPYCSEDCQKADRERHKEKCKIWSEATKDELKD